MKKVRGSMDTVPAISVGKSTVRIRSNIIRVEEDDFTGWEYDETTYKKDEFISKLTMTEDSDMLALLITNLMNEIDVLKGGTS